MNELRLECCEMHVNYIHLILKYCVISRVRFFLFALLVSLLLESYVICQLLRKFHGHSKGDLMSPSVDNLRDMSHLEILVGRV